MVRSRCNVAVLGCGRIAREHIAGYQRIGERFAIQAFVSRDLAQAAEYARRHGDGRSYTSLAEAAAAEELDAVDICLPPSEHCGATIQAADLGLHVLVEKPLAISCREVDMMIEAGKRNRTIIMSGQSRRFNGPLRKAKELIASGRIGEPLLASISYGMKVELVVPWWANPQVTGPSNLMANWGTHSLDELLYLYGPPARVYAEGRDTGGPTAGIDLFSAVFGYKSGLVANMSWSYVSELAVGQKGEVGELLPTKGIKTCMGSNGTLQYGQNAGATGVLLDGEPIPNNDTDVNQFHTMQTEFHDAIIEQRQPETCAVECRVVIEMGQAILESCMTHQVVPIGCNSAWR